MYQVHCAFPGTFITDSFLAEQASKPEITKIMEGSNMSDDIIRKKTPSSSTISKEIIYGLDKGYFAITSDWENRIDLEQHAWAQPSGQRYPRPPLGICCISRLAFCTPRF
jgi:3-dehydrosphinganine reductase